MSDLQERLEDFGINSVDSAELIDHINLQFEAGNVVDSGQPNGLISSLDYRRDGTNPDGLRPYAPGKDSIIDINIRATLASGRPMAIKKRRHDHPRKLYHLADYGERYMGSTGKHDLAALARLTLGVATVAVKEGRAQMQTVAVADGREIADALDDTPFEPFVTVEGYDSYVSSPAISPRGKQPHEGSSLARGLEYIAEAELRPRSDVALVVSDFTQGGQYNNKGNLVGFDWEEGLMGLAEQLDDRLYVARLTTPAQITPPLASEYSSNATDFELDEGEYVEFAESYAKLGRQKAERIQEIFKSIRYADISSTDSIPLATIGDFMFGSPKDF